MFAHAYRRKGCLCTHTHLSLSLSLSRLLLKKVISRGVFWSSVVPWPGRPAVSSASVVTCRCLSQCLSPLHLSLSLSLPDSWDLRKKVGAAQTRLWT